MSDLSVGVLDWLQGEAITNSGNRIVHDEATGETFLISGDDITRFEPYDAPQSITGRTLDGMLDAINKGLLESPVKSVHIVNPTIVLVYGVVDKFGRRPQLMRIEAYETDFRFGRFYDQEAFQIGLRAQFVQNDHRDVVIKFAGDLVDDDSTTFSDDGVSQTATVREGISSKAIAEVPSPATLAPRRTFVEVDQPESEFIYRVRKGGESALFEADGGAWRNEAIRNIAAYISTKLPEGIEVIA
jgi:hypothetical protein